MDADLRKQVAAQCKAIAHMATAIAQINADYERMLSDPGSKALDGIEETVGERTAAWMETLGDMLNSIDAVEKEDAWMGPVFREAQRRWPATSTPSTAECK
jgi:hypothetical protein